jgi:hypothetical protein
LRGNITNDSRMRCVRYAYVELLLFRTFIKTLVWQLYLKLTKFTRRANGPKSFLRKFEAGYAFLKAMSEYDLDIIRRCRRCVKNLTAENVPAVFVYGEKDVMEILFDLSFKTPMKMRILHEHYETDKKFGWEAISLETGASSTEKIIVASLVNTQERTRRLRELGVDNERIILLTNG